MNFTLMFGPPWQGAGIVLLTFDPCPGWWITDYHSDNYVGHPDKSTPHYQPGYFGWFLRHAIHKYDEFPDEGDQVDFDRDLPVLVIGRDSSTTHLAHSEPFNFELGEYTKERIRLLLADLEQEGFSARFVRHPIWGDEFKGADVVL